MLKNKRILLMLIIAIALIFMPNMVSAQATQATETTKTSTGVEVKWEYELDSNNDIVTLLCANKADIKGTLSIPSTIDGHKVKKLGASAFRQCTGLISVKLPESIATLKGNYSSIYGAFRGCSNLTKILIPDTVATIEK